MVHPLCGYPLQRGTMFLAIIEIILSVLYLIQNAIALGFYLPHALNEHNINSNTENWVEKVPRLYSMKSAITLLDSAYWSCALALGILLYSGTKQRDLRKCRQWFILTCILTVLFIVDVMMQAFSMQASMAEIASPVVATVLMSYMTWVVQSFMDELRLGGCIPIKNQGDIGS